MAAALQKTKHLWILSYDDCQEVRDLYTWADCRSVDVKYSITAMKKTDEGKDTGERLSTQKPELLIYPKTKDITNVADTITGAIE